METQIQTIQNTQEVSNTSSKTLGPSKLSSREFVNDIKNQVSISKISPEVRTRDIVKVIAIQAGLIGIKEAVHDVHKTDIAIMLVNRFGALSIEEIKYAFQIDRHGYHGEPTAHYQLFNAEYAAIVMNKYIKWRQEIRNTPQRFGAIKSKQNLEVTMTEDDKRILAKSEVIRKFDDFKYSPSKLKNSLRMKELLIFLELIPKYEDISDADKASVREKAIASIEKKRYHPYPSENKLQREKALNSKKTIVAECWMIIVSEFFDSLINKNQHISTLLKHIPDEE